MQRCLKGRLWVDTQYIIKQWSTSCTSTAPAWAPSSSSSSSSTTSSATTTRTSRPSPSKPPNKYDPDPVCAYPLPPISQLNTPIHAHLPPHRSRRQLGSALTLLQCLNFVGPHLLNIGMSKRTITEKLIESEEDNLSQTPLPTVIPHEYSYKVKNDEPQIKLSNFSLVIIAPLLMVLHTRVASLCGIPVLQYVFVTILTAFLINYMGIIRRYELYPYLPDTPLDNRLKISCFVSFAGMILSLYIGWNGSGGMLFAMFWEFTRGQRMSTYGLYFAAIIAGSLLMEENYSLSKLWEFLPGLCLGWVTSQIFKLRESNAYTISHQMMFIASIGLPVFFPATDMIVPNIWQWLVMIVCGGAMLVTIVSVVKLMQMVRVSVAVGLTVGILMAGTSHYRDTRAYFGVALIILGMAMLLKMQFINSM